MKNDLTDRYIYAVTKRMNPKIREDVKQELYGLVEDMLTERCGGMAPTEKDIRVVLTELGTPQEIYARYDENSNRSMIEAPYFGTYKLVTGIVLACTAIGMTVSSVIIHFEEAKVWYESLLSWLALMWSGCLQAFAIVTLLFAFFSWRGIQLGEPYNLDDLPPVPKKKQEISRGDCIFSLVFCAVFLTVFLAVPQYIIGYWGPDGVIPLFDVQILRQSWALILIFGLMGITRTVVRLTEGQHNRKEWTVTAVTNGIAAAAVTAWLTRPGLINPEFVSHVEAMFVEEAAFIQRIFTNFDTFLLVVILFALVLDTAEAAVKTFKK